MMRWCCDLVSVAVIVGVVILNTVAWGEGKVNHNAFYWLTSFFSFSAQWYGVSDKKYYRRL